MNQLNKIYTEVTGREDFTLHCFTRVIDAWLNANPPKDEQELANIVNILKRKILLKPSGI